MTKRFWGVIPAALLAVSGIVLIAGCSTAQPALSQCAMITNNGFGATSAGVTAVLHPGQKIQIGNNQLAWYYPCDARNFIFSPPGQPGDVHTPVTVRTAAQGGNPGMPVNVWLGIYFTPNQNDNAMKTFLPFCLKYGCAESSDQTDNSVQSNAHFSTSGWEGMLVENFPFAAQRAATNVISNFGPDLWIDPSQWPKLGDDIAAQLNAQLTQEDQSNTPFFCGASSTQSNCTQMTVVVNKVEPVDPAVQQIYNQRIAAESAIAANGTRLRAAQELYGSLAPYFLGIQDTISQCNGKAACNIYIGAPGTLPNGK